MLTGTDGAERCTAAGLAPQILVILAIQFAFCIAFAIANGFWLRETSEENAVYSLSSFSYQNNALNAFLNFFTLMIISQNLIPIAMYASVEIVKLVQVRARGKRNLPSRQTRFKQQPQTVLPAPRPVLPILIPPMRPAGVDAE